jgi:hypothetical protein
MIIYYIASAYDVACSFDEFFFDMKKGIVRVLDTKAGSQINFF